MKKIGSLSLFLYKGNRGREEEDNNSESGNILNPLWNPPDVCKYKATQPNPGSCNCSGFIESEILTEVL